MLDPLLGPEGSGKHKADLALPSWSLQSHEEARGSGKRQAGSGLVEYGSLLVRGDQRGPAEAEVTFEQRSWGGKSEPCERQGERAPGKGHSQCTSVEVEWISMFQGQRHGQRRGGGARQHSGCHCSLAHSCPDSSVTPRAVPRQAPPSMGLCRQEYWSGLPCPLPGGLPDPGIERVSLVSPHWQADS